MSVHFLASVLLNGAWEFHPLIENTRPHRQRKGISSLLVDGSLSEKVGEAIRGNTNSDTRHHLSILEGVGVEC